MQPRPIHLSPSRPLFGHLAFIGTREQPSPYALYQERDRPPPRGSHGIPIPRNASHPGPMSPDHRRRTQPAPDSWTQSPQSPPASNPCGAGPQSLHQGVSPPLPTVSVASAQTNSAFVIPLRTAFSFASSTARETISAPSTRPARRARHSVNVPIPQ